MFDKHEVHDVRNRAAAIIIQNGSLLVIRRIRNGRVYFILPGGGIEPGENIIAACIREVKEETGLEVTHLTDIFSYNNEGNTETYFRVQVIPRQPILGKPEVDKQTPEDQYVLEWIDFDKLTKINLYPEAAKNICLDILKFLCL